MKNLQEYLCGYLSESAFDNSDDAVMWKALEKFLYIFDYGTGNYGVCPELISIEDGVLKIDVPNNVIELKLHFDYLPKFIKEIKIR